MNFKFKYLTRPNFSLSAEGNSMIPLINSGDIIYFKKARYSQYKINDIVLIKKTGEFFTHRVIYKNGGCVITKGDNNFESDKKIFPKQLFGKVYKIKRGKKTFQPNNLYLAQSSLYFQEIIKIKPLLEKQRIRYVFLKGLPLHLYFEKTYPKRIYLDCDVLVKRPDFAIIDRILVSLGYKKEINRFAGIENNYIKFINGFPVVFDVHVEPAFLMTQLAGLEALYNQELINRFTNELLNNNKQISINNEKFFILNTKYLILYLALHLFHHNFHGAFRYEFLNKVIVQTCIKQDKKDVFFDLGQKIKEYHLQNFVYPVFILLKKYYKTLIPVSFIKLIKPTRFVNFIDPKKVDIFDEEPRTEAGINRFKTIFFLSPRPLWRKFTIILHPKVIYYVSIVMWKRLLVLVSKIL